MWVEIFNNPVFGWGIRVSHIDTVEDLMHQLADFYSGLTKRVSARELENVIKHTLPLVHEISGLLDEEEYHGSALKLYGTFVAGATESADIAYVGNHRGLFTKELRIDQQFAVADRVALKAVRERLAKTKAQIIQFPQEEK